MSALDARTTAIQIASYSSIRCSGLAPFPFFLSKDFHFMPISASTLSALQKVGAAAFHADEKWKNEVGVYAQRANAAIFNNPYNLGNAALIESWQVVARLSKKLSGIEEELRNLYRIADELTEDDLPIVRETPALAAPAPAPAPVAAKKAAKKSISKAIDLTATTVKVKKASKKQAPKVAAVATAPAAKGKKTVAKPLLAKKATTPAALPTKPAKKTPVAKTQAVPASPAPAKAKTQAMAKGAKVKATRAAVASQELTGNPAKLLAHLQTILNAEAFEHLNQTVLFKETGIPLGSIGATLGRLTKAGRLVAGPQGSYKLAKERVKAAAVNPVPAQPEVQAAAATEAQA